MRTWMLIGTSLVFGGMSAFAIDQHLTAKTEEIESRNRVEQSARVVAAHDLKRGIVLQLSDLATRDIPLQWLSPDAIEIANVHLVPGKQLNADVQAGQPVLGLYLSDRVSPALSAKLEPGRRAITIPVDQINSMSGLLNPADKIDLYVSFDHHGKRVTAALLSGVEVLATGHHTAAPSDRPGERDGTYATVTLETSSEDAVKLVAARQSGTITAVLSREHGGVPARKVPRAAPGGHLAGLLGLDDETKFVSVPVIYGDHLRSQDMVPERTIPWGEVASMPPGQRP